MKNNGFNKYGGYLATGILACYLAWGSPQIPSQNNFYDVGASYASSVTVEDTTKDMYARRRHRRERRSHWWGIFNIFRQLKELEKRKYRIPPEKKIRSEKEDSLNHIA